MSYYEAQSACDLSSSTLCEDDEDIPTPRAFEDISKLDSNDLRIARLLNFSSESASRFLPILYFVNSLFLNVPATSIDVEQTFSVASLLKHKKREALHSLMKNLTISQFLSRLTLVWKYLQ